jgi:hypothetical protein
MQRLPLESWSEQDRRFVARSLACVLMFYTACLIAILWVATGGELFARNIDTRAQSAVAAKQLPILPSLMDAD